MNKQSIFFILFLVGGLFVLQSCSRAKGEDPGHEYMPDMGHAVSYEANVLDDYYYNTWDKESVKGRKELSMPRQPIAGTMPRGYAGVALAQDGAAMMSTLRGYSAHSAIATPVSGHVPYYYGNTDEERARAIAEIGKNPYPITASGLAKGKELYVIYCGICHGDGGAGNGYLVREDGGKYPAQPANLLSDEFITSSNGRYYHAIMYGRNVMGGYSEKLSYEERWQVIHYIRSLQAKSKKLNYDEKENTLNDGATPYAVWAAAKEVKKEVLGKVETTAKGVVEEAKAVIKKVEHKVGH